jgi:predicted O-methyltransferase YrrM
MKLGKKIALSKRKFESWFIRPSAVEIVDRDEGDLMNVTSESPQRATLIDTEKMSALSESIRGMITSRAGQELFSLAYMQALRGDVLEVGSFQGRSTFFLGSAVKWSQNGELIAIDHFRGNPGKEEFYVVGSPDLSDLEAGFRTTIKRAGLEGVVRLVNQPNYLAAQEVADQSVRLLFIDGDHTSAGVSRDLELFLPKLKGQAIIVFDDYDPEVFPGLVEVVDKFLSTAGVTRAYTVGETLVVQL